jgi:hypothetical protein
MSKKLIGLFGCMLLIVTTLPVSSTITVEKDVILTINDGTLSGYVNDTLMNPIEGALVRVYFHGTYEEDYTDATGYYHVTNIPICYCMKNCTASKSGYKSEWALLSIVKNTTYDFVLDPLGPCYPVLNGTMGWNGWWISPVTVSFVFDPEEVAEIWYNYKGWHLYTKPFIVDENGTININFYWINHEGEKSPQTSIMLDIDQIPPWTNLDWETYKERGFWYVKFIFTADDDISGMHEEVEMYINNILNEIVCGPGPDYKFIIPLNIPMKFVAKFMCHDNAGNEAFELVNSSDIESYTYSPSYSMLYLRWFERFPLLQKILDVLRPNNR